MSALKLNFLDNHDDNSNSIVSMLENYGQDIENYSQGYFIHSVNWTSDAATPYITIVNLYIIASEIKYEYKIISVEINALRDAKVLFFDIKNNKVDEISVGLSDGIKVLDETVKTYLSSKQANSCLAFLVNQILISRDFQS